MINDTKLFDCLILHSVQTFDYYYYCYSRISLNVICYCVDVAPDHLLMSRSCVCPQGAATDAV